METKILKAVFGGGTSTVTNKRTRTDYGQVLEIIGIDLPDTFECIFSNSATSAGTGKKMIGSSQRVLIPDEYLTTGQTIYAWILLHDTEDDGRHMYSVRIPVADMPDTSPEEPTPVEQSVISQAITALNTAVGTTSQKAQEASDSADRAEQAAEGAEGYAERAEAAQSASESARDRAVEAETSARTSAATASEKASEAISSATTASQSAMTAETASESARASATASAESASQSSQSAESASESASASAGNANFAASKALDASNSASEAAQSASSASQAKTDAETAKQASETAQGLAETARNEAVTAKEDAESARNEAQEIADGITGKVEQIDSNTDRIESLEDDRYKPYVVDSASGSIASFSDGADGIPLKSCIVQVEPVQAGSGDPSPDNVRPITGWTGTKVTRTGVNVLNPSLYSFQTKMRNGLTYTVQQDGTVKVTGTATATGGPTLTTYFKLKPGTYCYRDEESQHVHCAYRRILTPGGSSTALANPFTTDGTDYIYVNMFCDATGTYDLVTHPQISVGSTLSDFTPYTGEAISVSFGQTVYGGTLDVTKGVLTVDMAMVDLGTLTWNASTRETTYKIFSTNGIAQLIKDPVNNWTIPTNFICSQYKTITFNEVYEGNTNGVISFAKGNHSINLVDSDFADYSVTEVAAALSGVQLVYELATPIHYPITSSQINSLYGQNNLWANTGDTEVEYRADTKLYIKRLTDSDTDMVADANITSGSYFMVGNDLYRATVNIASGSQVIEGTNATRVSLATALNEINA